MMRNVTTKRLNGRLRTIRGLVVAASLLAGPSVVSSAVIAYGQEVAGQQAVDLKSDVLQWVDELDADSLSKRKAAERALIDAGPAALEFLPKSKPGISIEAVERLSRVRKTLMQQRTESETESDAIRVMLDDVSTLGDALEAISRDSGVEFDHDADVSLAIDPVATPLSFWHAVDLVLDQANLDINFYAGDESTLKLVSRDPERPSRVDSAAYAGVYRIEPTAVTSRRSLNNPTLSGLNISIEIAWQPRVTPIGLTLPIAQLSGELDDGEKLKPQESGETIDVATNSDIAFSEFFLPMQLPAGQPGKIESLSGLIRALLPGKKQTFEMPLSNVGEKTLIDSMTVEIESLRPNGPLHEVRVGIELKDADRSLESHRHWIFENEVHVLRKDGSRADHLGYEVYRQTAAGVGIGYLFDLGDTAGESKLIYRSPTAVVPSEVSFVIQDILLP
ncbi:hypothetical protein [Rubripirellula reticaptiva]|uniref:Uncharacterized protein n=1 Tax=Rubripirellula reticaptiva TaxID=2528013 RepID=A0A5C6F4U9_9BACT|nr:hypothetical protein [Rubripirellula reticaptiva]TWU55540.1 hypothetical protein Poly59_18400 [Rubripirellula reticaptiva]